MRPWAVEKRGRILNLEFPEIQKPIRFLPHLIHPVMRPDIDGNDLLVVDQKFDGQPVAERDGDGVEALEFALQCVDAQGGVEGVGFHEQQAFFVVAQEFRVLFEKLPCPPDIALREDDCVATHRSGL